MNKRNKIIKKIAIICVIVIIIELLIMLIMKIKNDRDFISYDNLNDMIVDDNYFIGVGSSDFSNSSFVNKKIYNYKNQNLVAMQGKITKYNNDFELLLEKSYESKYDSIFYSVVKANDGFIAVGYVVSNEEQIDVNTHDGLIVKFDNDFNVIWSKTYNVLGDTKFTKIIDDGDNNYVIIGHSIYENMEIGNHITGGGIIVRINNDGEITSRNNYGGNKSGIFNDIIKVKDGYIVCGKDATNYGIIVKFQNDFNRDEKDNSLITKKIMWQRTYSNTDNIGFTSMTMINDVLYVSGALNISDEKDKDGNLLFKYDAGVVVYNTSGKYLGKKVMGNSKNHNLFTSLATDNKYIYLTKMLDIDNTNEKKKSSIVKYDLEGNLIKEETYDIDNIILNKIITNNNQFLVIGMSDTKCSMLSGCDYEPIIRIYDNELKTIK